MMQEKKSLLLQDLCARLPYGVKVTWSGKHSLTVTPHIYCAIASEDNIKNLPKLLLRPMSSMTKDEKKAYNKTLCVIRGCGSFCTIDTFDYLLSHGFDVHDLIPKGLALEAPKDMYNIN